MGRKCDRCAQYAQFKFGTLNLCADCLELARRYIKDGRHGKC